MYIYIYTYIYIYAYIRTYIHKYINTSIKTCIHMQGFRKSDLVLATYWATADLQISESAQQSFSTLPTAIVDRYMDTLPYDISLRWQRKWSSVVVEEGENSGGGEKEGNLYRYSQEGGHKIQRYTQGKGAMVLESDRGGDSTIHTTSFRETDSDEIAGNRDLPKHENPHQQLRIGSSHDAEIIGVVPRLNFDSFYTSFSTVFIIWTLTDWSFIMQPLVQHMSVTAIIYFAFAILIGNFFLQVCMCACMRERERERARVCGCAHV